MSMLGQEYTFTATVNANARSDIWPSKLKYGPIGIVAIYVQSANGNNYELKIGNVTVAQGKGVTTAWDRDINKLTPVMVGALPGEEIELYIDNSANASADTVTVTVFYAR